MNRSSVRRVEVQGQTAWLKQYGEESRRVRLAALDWLARRLGIDALRPARRPCGDFARVIEQRRIAELQAVGAQVPFVLASGESVLVLSDLGETLAARLRLADAAQREALLSRAAAEISRVHGEGQYLGQPVARNIVVDAAGRIGFIDFEEDPVEVMDLEQAQVRDWLLFTSATARHANLEPNRLAELLAPALRTARSGVGRALSTTVDRLRFVVPISLRLGPRAAGVGQALQALQRTLIAWAGPILLLSLGADLIHDGEIELLSQVIELLD